MSQGGPESRRLRGNELLRLDDPAAAWRVERGSVALFGVPLRDGKPHGPRRFFFSVGAGRYEGLQVVLRPFDHEVHREKALALVHQRR